MDAKEQATRRVADALAALGHLANAIARENAALRDPAHTGLRQRAEEKIAAARTYEAKVKAMTDPSVDLGLVDPAVRDRLRGLGETLETVSRENEQRLSVAIAANQRLVDMLADAVKEVQNGAGTYGKSGSVGPAGKRTPPGGVAVSLDENL